MASSSELRGLDGLTEAELRASRRGFWEVRFTELLLRDIEPGTERLVDVGCGLGTAAHALLPHLPLAQYRGVDADRHRVVEATRLLEGAPYADRVEFTTGRAEQLPCRDGEASVILYAMTLQHLSDIGAALGEAQRVLTPNGVVLAVEPDNLGQRCYFDGPLEDLNRALADLAAAVREARRPADSAVGPAVPAMLERAGFGRVMCNAYCTGGLRRATAREVFDAAGRVVEITASAAGLDVSDARVERARDAVARARADLDPAAIGYGGQVVPVFVSSARRGV